MGLGGTGGVTISESITEVTNKLDFEGWQEFAIESCAHANTHIHAGREWMSKRRVTANTYMEGPGIPVGIRPKGPALSPLVIPVWQGSSLRRIWLPTWCIWRTSLSLQPGATINEQCRHWWDLQYQVAILLQFLSIFPSLQSCHFIPSPYSSNSSFISKRCPSFYFKKPCNEKCPDLLPLNLHFICTHPTLSYCPTSYLWPVPWLCTHSCRYSRVQSPDDSSPHFLPLCLLLCCSHWPHLKS